MGPNNAFQFFSHSFERWADLEFNLTYVYISVKGAEEVNIWSKEERKQLVLLNGN